MIQTPIEEYKLKGKTVHVKRDDLVGNGTTLPRWAKIEGIRKILESDYIDKSKPNYLRINLVVSQKRMVGNNYRMLSIILRMFLICKIE